MKHYLITIARPVAVPRKTYTTSWTEYNADLVCTCGWRDRTFAENARTLAARHNEQRHSGLAVVRTEDTTQG